MMQSGGKDILDMHKIVRFMSILITGIYLLKFVQLGATKSAD